MASRVLLRLAASTDNLRLSHGPPDLKAPGTIGATMRRTSWRLRNVGQILRCSSVFEQSNLQHLTWAPRYRTAVMVLLNDQLDSISYATGLSCKLILPSSHLRPCLLAHLWSLPLPSLRHQDLRTTVFSTSTLGLTAWYPLLAPWPPESRLELRG